ncbi:MAG TPA: preprotein translocase subunit YajC [Ornithinimicrobium sp.]|uniref:preprotein translocase subunit YajC n=1 Tax=Ornithinimicrobium sp. TaxID=1977084 RepID=UPI002B47746E|nr:preprotein translocase subunit YajC [Ornithinimicrobium sp.]HKJ11786.1 preprotein translocase subunit YajC [Ornithinimicrobium sp.]
MHVYAAAASGGGSGSLSLLILTLPLLLLAYLIFSQRRRARREAKVQQELAEGDEVMTRAGMFGTITWLNGPVVGVQVAPGVVLTFDRRAVIPAVVPSSRDAGQAQDPDPDAPDDGRG